MKEVMLTVSSREGTGKGPARRVRMSGNIPAVIYGPQTKPVSVQVSHQEFQSAWKTGGGSSAIYNLALGGKSRKVLIRELQRDPVTSEIVHVDFHAISMSKPIPSSVLRRRETPTTVGGSVGGNVMTSTVLIMAPGRSLLEAKMLGTLSKPPTTTNPATTKTTDQSLALFIHPPSPNLQQCIRREGHRRGR